MAKVVGQSVPPALAALYAALAAPNKVIQGPDGALRMKPSVKRPKKKPRRNLDLIAIQRVAQIVADELQAKTGQANPPGFVYDLTQELILGIFDARYFQKCQVKVAVTLDSTPTYSADPAPPPYIYRDPGNLPSVPVYPNGTPTTGGASYSGQQIGGLFADTNLKWRKLAFTSKAVDKIKGEERVLIRWNTRIDIHSSNRGSRPMVSLFLKAHICSDASPDLASTEPPLHFKTCFYWRFKVPPSAAPFYNSYQVRSLVKPFGRIAKKSGPGQFTTYLLNVSNRPMMGRGFNNNSSVNTSFTADPELWEIRSCLGVLTNIWEIKTGAYGQYPKDFAYAPVPNKFEYVPAGYRIAWSPSLALFVSVQNIGTIYTLRSKPAVGSWTYRTDPNSGSYTAVAWSGKLGIFVALSYRQPPNGAAWSTDGINWSKGTTPAGFWAQDCIWVDELNLFVAAGEGSYGGSMTSPDGKNWSIHADDPTRPGLTGVCWSPELGILVAVSHNGYDAAPYNYTFTSADGINWAQSGIGIYCTLFSVAWCAPLGQFFAVGYNWDHAIMVSSSDGISWSEVAYGFTQQLSAIKFFEEICSLIAVTPTGTTPNVFQLKHNG